jgi:hypothetical protein
MMTLGLLRRYSQITIKFQDNEPEHLASDIIANTIDVLHRGG